MQATVRELLDEGRQQLENAGIINPRLAAELILRHLLSLRRVDLFLQDDQAVPDGATLIFRSMIARKISREPLQYILGETEWFGLSIKCTKAALIPRPETEIIVEQGLRLIAEIRDPLVADIGTGSGCIAVAVAAQRPDARVVASDVSAEALSLARTNILNHEVADRIELRQGDTFEPLETASPYDLIISNPPYVSTSELFGLMPEVRDYEPRGALLAGSDGLDVIRVLVAEAHRYLRSGGFLVLEIGERQANMVRTLAAAAGVYDILDTILDYNAKDRGVALRKK